MDFEKLIEAVRLCGGTPKVDQCKQCAYWSGGDMSKCIPRMTTDAATALSTLQAENEKLRAEADGMRSNWYKAVEEINSLRAELDEKEKYYDQMIDALSATDNAELEQVKLERDDARATLDWFRRHGIRED